MKLLFLHYLRTEGSLGLGTILMPVTMEYALRNLGNVRFPEWEWVLGRGLGVIFSSYAR